MQDTSPENKPDSPNDLHLKLLIHDIINLSQGAIGNLELALMEAELDGRSRNHVERALDQVGKTAALIDTMQRIRRVQDQSSHLMPLSLNMVLENVMSEDDLQVDNRPIAIDWTMPGREYSIHADDFIYDLFTGVIKTIVSSTEQSQYTIRVNIRSSTMHERKYAVVEFHPEGLRLPFIAHDRNRMGFVPRGNLGTGVGIGVSLINVLIERYGGHLWLETPEPGPEPGDQEGSDTRHDLENKRDTKDRTDHENTILIALPLADEPGGE